MDQYDAFVKPMRKTWHSAQLELPLRQVTEVTLRDLALGSMAQSYRSPFSLLGVYTGRRTATQMREQAIGRVERVDGDTVTVRLNPLPYSDIARTARRRIQDSIEAQARYMMLYGARPMIIDDPDA